jgi:AraC-like DNA-binding protein
MNLQAISTDSTLMSLKDYGSFDFPVRFYLDDFQKMPLGHINWNWHKQIELSYVLDGEMDYSVGEIKTRLRQGEAIFVNSERLHTFKPTIENEETLALSIVFNSAILSYGVESVVYQKYIMPIILDKHFPCLVLKKDVHWQTDILGLLVKLNALHNEQPYGFELAVQSLLVQIWLKIVLNLERKAPEGRNHTDLVSEDRLKQMILYIQSMFYDTVTLDQIASSASVSKSECIRCFKYRLGITPVEYLIEFRISRAMILLDENNLPIVEIGQRCGFESASYFTKIFKRRTGFTPSSYRKRRASL